MAAVLPSQGALTPFIVPAARQHLLITLRNTGHDNNARPHARHTIPSGCQSSWRLKRADRLGSLQATAIKLIGQMTFR
jgi:hypothetical protein